MRIFLETANLTPELAGIANELAVEYPIACGRPSSRRASDILVRLQPGAQRGMFQIERRGNGALLKYDALSRACRGLGALLSGLVPLRGTYSENTTLETFGVMLDCSRNAVMKPEHVRRWLRRMALLGYNQLMLYTENTYELQGEPYFGYRRGRYSLDELRALDATAAALGIELVGCIQTLGHLEQMLRFPEYAAVQDTASVMLVDEPATYKFLEKMIATTAAAFRSRRLHIGMDEAFDLGRGRSLTLRGFEEPFELFSRHLARVSALCKKHGLKPMIWSDMFFRMGSRTHDYYDPKARIPASVAKRIPREVDLVYWDYDNKPVSAFVDMIKRHRALGHEPVMATAVHSWQTPWMADISGVAPALEACRCSGLREALVTLWGDDGAYCEFDSALAGLTKAADIAFGLKPKPSALQARFRGICGSDYKAVMLVAGMHHPRFVETTLLWDDPLLRVAWVNEGLLEKNVWRKYDSRLAAILRGIQHCDKTQAPVDFAHAAALLRFMRAKIAFQQNLDAAYYGKNRTKIKNVRRMIPDVVKTLDKLLESFRRQWRRRNKPAGFETIQIRLGGQRLRWLELAERLDELTDGRATSLPELDERPDTPSAWTHVAWRYLAVSGIA